MHYIGLKHTICGILTLSLSLIMIINAHADVSPPLFTSETITLYQPTHNKTHEYVVEIANNEAQREHGLKFRSSLKDNYGMLFLFPHVNDIYMWMKDTYVPLDMIFLNSTGEIVTIVENTTPMSEEVISSKVPVAAVLELKGGTVQKQGIIIGDMVLHSHFEKQ